MKNRKGKTLLLINVLLILFLFVSSVNATSLIEISGETQGFGFQKSGAGFTWHDNSTTLDEPLIETFNASKADAVDSPTGDNQTDAFLIHVWGHTQVYGFVKTEDSGIEYIKDLIGVASSANLNLNWMSQPSSENPPLGGVDSTSPTYSGLSSSTTDQGTVCDFNATFNDETALESSGEYYFSTNNTGTWTNNTVASFVSTPETISVQKTLNSTVDMVVGYKWYFSDNAGNWNSTTIETLTITDITVASYGTEYQDNSSTKTKVHPSTTSGKSGHSQGFTGDPTLYLYEAQFYMKKVGSPEGVLSSRLYTQSGGLPVESSVLETSSSITMESLTTEFVLYSFTFSRTTKFSAQDYCIAVYVESATVLDDENYVVIGTGGDGTGNGKKTGHYKNGGWVEDPDVDLIFYIYGGTESSTPTYSDVSHSTTEAGATCYFNITANDETALESDGQYIFATNTTGSWICLLYTSPSPRDRS